MKLPKLSEHKWYNGAVIVCIGVAFFVLLWNFGTVLATLRTFLGYFRPVILGAVIAYIMNPLAKIFHYRVFRRLKNRKIRWYLSVFLSFAVMLLAFFLLIGMLIPQLIHSIMVFSHNFGSYTESLTDMLYNSPISSLLSKETIDVLYDNAMSAISAVVNEVAENTMTIARNAGKNIITTGLALIISVYLLIDYKTVLVGSRKFLETILPANVRFEFLDFILRCDTILTTYIAQTLLDALVIGVANAVFMLICRMPYIGLVSVIVGVTNLIPNFGPAIGAAIGAFILLLAAPRHAVFFLIFCLILQSVDAYILKPKLFSGALGVSGLTILISTIVLGNMFGIVGVLFSIPAAAIISFVYHEYYMKRFRKQPEKKRVRE